MTASHRIAIAEDEPRILTVFEILLRDLGHEVVAKAQNGKQLVERCLEVRPDLVITDIRMPEMDGLQAAAQLCQSRPVPVILVSAYNEPEYIQSALHNSVLAYLVKPIKTEDVQPVIRLAMRRYKELQALRQQVDDLRQALEDRKMIERAKGILMKRLGFNEPDAFRRLQLLSSQKNKRMADVARILVEADEAFV